MVFNPRFGVSYGEVGVINVNGTLKGKRPDSETKNMKDVLEKKPVRSRAKINLLRNVQQDCDV